MKLHWWKFGIIATLTAWLYLPIVSRLVQQWVSDSNYSHGFLVPVFSAFVLWNQRSRLTAGKSQPSTWGLLILILGTGLLVIGILGAELFLQRFSLLVWIAGLVVFFFGWQHFRAVLFPWAFLILMLPIPAIVFSRISMPLQILASKMAATFLPFVGVPVLREGNIINLPAMPLEVAEACSGIRSLFSLVTIALIYGFVAEKRRWVRILLALASVPVAVLANSLRIVGTGMIAEYWNSSKAEGFFHIISGWIVFVMCVVLLFSLHWLIGTWRRREVRCGGL